MSHRMANRETPPNPSGLCHLRSLGKQSQLALCVLYKFLVICMCLVPVKYRTSQARSYNPQGATVIKPRLSVLSVDRLWS